MTIGTLPRMSPYMAYRVSDEDHDEDEEHDDDVQSVPAPEREAAAYTSRRPSLSHAHGHRRPLLFALLWTLLRRAAGELGTSGHDLSNFQGKHACDARVRMAAPRTALEVSEVGFALRQTRFLGSPTFRACASGWAAHADVDVDTS